MEISGLKRQQIYLMKKVNNLSDELVNVMELLELVSQIIEQDEKQKEDDQTNDSNNDSDSEDDDIKPDVIQLLETYSDEN